MAIVDFGGVGQVEVGGAPAPLELTNTKKAGFIARLFPLGFYFDRTAGWVPSLSRGLARFVSRWVKRVEDFERQMDPRTADELLPDHERLFELVPDPAATLEDRRAAALAKWRSTGGTTAEYYESVAADFGYLDAVVTDAGFPATCNGTCNQALLGGEWLLTFRLTAASQGATRDAALEELIRGQPLLAGWFAVFDFT
jgi:uncharacterized protein YmfQ (DUF2313 family)